MPGLARWAYYRPHAYAVIDGVEFDVVKLVVNYELNSISSGTLMLPVGRRLTDDGVAAIHDAVGRLGERVPVQVYASFDAADRSDETVSALGLPDGPFLLFDGLAVFGHYDRSAMNAVYNLSLVHWAALLGEGSCFSYSSHPTNPAQYSFGAVLPQSDDAGTKPNWTVLTQASEAVNAQSIGEDLWGSALYKWFETLAAQDMFAVWERNLTGDASNTVVKDALERFKPGGPYYVPLELNQQAVEVDVDLAEAIATDFGRALYPGQIANQTFWDLLVGRFASDYAFAVVPRVSYGLIVPFLPGYRGNDGKAFADILAAEQTSSESSAVMPRPLRGYGILSGMTSRAGTNMMPDDGAAITGVGGWYSPPDKKGAVLIGQAPGWLSSILSPSLYADDASGAFEGCGDALNPGKGKANEARTTAPAKAKRTKSALDAYAKCRYAQEILKGRMAVISGIFRTDVAPGSLVRIEGASERFLADTDQLGGVSYGQVLRVTLVLDAETPAAGTGLHIGFVRSERENDEDATSMDSHPLYKNAFLGCPLIDA